MKFNPFWRLLALLTIILYAVLTLLIVRLVIHNVGFIILFGLTAVCFAGAVWALFGGTGDRGRKLFWPVGLLVVLIIVEVIYFIHSGVGWRSIVGFALLTIAYLGLLTLLRRKYWSSKRQLAQQSAEMARFKKPYLIMNPKSGNGRAMKAHIDTLAAEQNLQVLVLQKGDDVEAIARKAVRAGADVLGISGGDGSIGAVVKVALEYELPIVVLPGGTRCHFARDLGLDSKRIVDALKGFRGVERRVDVGSINGRCFLNNASFGMYADIIDSPDYRDHKSEVSRNIVRSIISGEKELYDLRFKHGKQRVNKALQVLVGVNCYDTFNVLELGHRDRLDEGVLQVTAIIKPGDSSMRQLFATSYKEKLQGMYQWKTATFKITSKGKKLVVGVDGEKEEFVTPVTVHILPTALRVFVPPEGVRGRPKSAFGLPVTHEVWRTIRR